MSVEKSLAPLKGFEATSTSTSSSVEGLEVRFVPFQLVAIPARSEEMIGAKDTSFIYSVCLEEASSSV